MTSTPFNRQILKNHCELSVLAWILASVAWEKRTIEARSGKASRLVELKPFQVYAPINRIHRETSVSVGHCHKIISDLVESGVIEKHQVQMYAKVKSPFIIELVHPFWRSLVKSTAEIYQSSVKP